MLSGSVTIISSATNLLVNVMLIYAKGRSMHMFELTWVGIPITIAGVLFVIAFNRWLLPDRRPVAEQFGDPREYSVEMMVDPCCAATIDWCSSAWSAPWWISRKFAA